MLDSIKYDPLSPKRIDDIVGNVDIWKSTALSISNNLSPHIILVGPAGCGKSLFMRIALGGFATIVIDCTANFGLRDVRDRIRNFARGIRPNGNYRWIVFEHADSLTGDTQAFLRRMLETTSTTTRFMFICKEGGAITEPIMSRASFITVNAPDDTECTFEIQRRTQFRCEASIVRDIIEHSRGNLRSALLNAFAALFVKTPNRGPNSSLMYELLAKRPEDKDSGKWVDWAILAETTARNEGIDLRDILRIGWKADPIVANTCGTWSRLGGTSPRSLFFDCISKLCAFNE